MAIVELPKETSGKNLERILIATAKSKGWRTEVTREYKNKYTPSEKSGKVCKKRIYHGTDIRVTLPYGKDFGISYGDRRNDESEEYGVMTKEDPQMYIGLFEREIPEYSQKELEEFLEEVYSKIREETYEDKNK